MNDSRCDYEWSDGWGTHRCRQYVQHHQAKHHCECDAYVPVSEEAPIPQETPCK